MCLVSNVGDHYSRKESWPTWPNVIPFPQPHQVPYVPPTSSSSVEGYALISTRDLAELHKQIEDMKKELIEAKRQDILNGDPDCEMEEKVVILKQIAKLFNIELNEVFPDDNS